MLKRSFAALVAFLIPCLIAARVLVGAGHYVETFWGDSLTAGAGSSGTSATYPYVVANTGPVGRWYFNGGVGGQTSTQIGVRQGSVSTTATVSGGQIPASGGVTVTFPSGSEPVTTQGPFNGVNGTISGVYGTVTLSGGVYTFTRAVAGGTVSVSSAPFVVDVGSLNNGTVVIWAGRNNYSNAAQVRSDIAAMVGSLTHSRYLVLSIPNGEYSNEHLGQSAYNTIIQLNSDLAATYGSHYVDVRQALVAAYNPANTMDVADHAADVPPFSLRTVNLSGTIVGALGASDTSFTTSVAVGAAYVLKVDSEYIYITSASGTSVTSAVRGYGGSVAATHSAGVAFAGTDPLHYADGGYSVVSSQVYAKINANGW
jgi:hypothetical protein